MRIEIRRASASDEPIVQAIFEASPTYFRRVDGAPVEAHFARREMTDEPDKRSATYEKAFCLLSLDGVPIGVADWHRDHPAKGIAYLGLLLIVDHLHGRGIGRAAYAAAEQFAIDELHASTLMLGVSDRNEVQEFWEKLGFRPTGQTYLWRGERLESQVTELEKTVVPPHA